MSNQAGQHPAFAHHFADLEGQKEAASLGMWVFIAQEIMFFGGLFAAYTVYRHQYFSAFEAGSHHLNILLGAFNTAVLICSSLTMAMAVHAAAVGKRTQIVVYLLATILLGSVFLGVKVVEYDSKIHPCFAEPKPQAGVARYEGCLVPGARFDAEDLRDAEHRPLAGDVGRQSQIYYSLYFAMTGLHALHMIIGIPIIVWIAWRANRGEFDPEYHSPVELTGLYWHFVDIIWIFLFPLLYLIA